MKLFQRKRGADPRPSVIASAALVDNTQIRTAVRTDQWQREAWEYYDTISHLRYGLTWIANAMSQCTLYVGVVDDDTGDTLGSSEPADDATVRQPLDELLASQASTGYLLHRMGLHLLVVGETFLVGFDQPDRSRNAPKRRWLACSSDEITTGTGGRVQIRLPESDQQHDLSGSDYAMFRVWRPHPRRAFQADSSVRALRPDLGELQYLSNYVQATARSRSTRGLLIAPQSASFATPEESENLTPLHSDPYINAMLRSFKTGSKDPSSPSSVVPTITRVPDDSTGKFDHLDLSADFDDQIRSLREDARANVTKGLELPQELLDGLGDTNHWSAWRVFDSAITLSIKPLVGLICDSLTDMYLRPALERLGITDPDGYRVDVDSSALTLRANRAPEALSLYEQGLLTREVVLREHGYSEDDLPDDDEAREVLTRQLVVADPSLVHALYPDLIRAESPPSTESGARGDNQADQQPADPGTGRDEIPNLDRARPDSQEPAPPQREGARSA